MNIDEYVEKCAVILHNAVEDITHEGDTNGGVDWDDVPEEDQVVLIQAMRILINWQVVVLADIMVSYDS